MPNNINESFLSAANASGGTGNAVANAAKETAAVNNGAGFTEQDVQKAYKYVTETNKILEAKSILPKARAGKTDREFFVKQGASAGIAIARLAATGGLDVTAWAQLGIAIGQAVAGAIKTIQANEAEESAIKKLYDTYPFWVMPCFKGNNNQKEGSFDYYGNEFVNCATERDRSLRVLKLFEKFGDDTFSLITTYAALIYGSSVRNGDPEMFVFGKYDFGTLAGQNSSQSESDKNLIRKTIDYYKNQGRIRLQGNGDFEKAPFETKVNYVIDEKINAYAWQGAVQNATHNIQNLKDDEIIFLKDLSAAIMLSDGITSDIAYKDVSYGLIGEMRWKVQQKPNESEKKTNIMSNKTMIYLGLAVAALLIYYFWFRKK